MIKNNSEPKISIIIPVYNVAEYLSECLDSVITQTLSDLEIICIDDGSTDSSLNILREYEKGDNRFTIISQNNKGAAQSRNIGMDAALGEYIAFMDSDDFYPNETTLEVMYNTAIMNNVNICGGSLNRFEHGERIVNPNDFDSEYTFNNNEVLQFLDYQYDYGFWRFIYKRSFLIQHNLRFPDYLRQEDPVFFVKAMYYAKEFFSLKNVTYVYRKIQKNITWSERMSFDTFASIQYLLLFTKEHELFNLHCKLVKRLNAWTFRTMIANTLKYVSVYNQCIATLKSIDLQILHENNVNVCFDDTYKSIIKASENSILVSVIVPVFNTEEYLLKCLDSICEQTFPHIEIICINDGSTDNSLQILEDYAKKDNRIVLITKVNGGLSSARNAGLDIAKGFFVYFIDSDDWIEPTTLEECIAKMTGDVDIVQFGVNIIYDGIDESNYSTKVSQAYYNVKLSGTHEMTNDVVLASNCSACSKVFKKNIIDTYNIRFPEGLLFEDNEFSFKYFLHVNKTYNINKNFYNYLQRSNSIMDNVRSCKTTKATDILYVYQNIYRHYKKYSAIQRNVKLLATLFQNYFLQAYKHAPKGEKKKVLLVATKIAKRLDRKFFENTAISFIQKKQYTRMPMFVECSAFDTIKGIKNYVLSQLSTARIDIKNFGSNENNISISGDVVCRNAAWYTNEQGIGVFTECNKKKYNIKIKIVKDGKLVLLFRGQDKKKGAERIPIWIDYTSVKINGEEMLSESIETWHDKPYKFEMPVTDGQVVDVRVVQKCHKYNLLVLEDMVGTIMPEIQKLDSKVQKRILKKYTLLS